MIAAPASWGGAAATDREDPARGTAHTRPSARGRGATMARQSPTLELLPADAQDGGSCLVVRQRAERAPSEKISRRPMPRSTPSTTRGSPPARDHRPLPQRAPGAATSARTPPPAAPRRDAGRGRRQLCRVEAREHLASGGLPRHLALLSARGSVPPAGQGPGTPAAAKYDGKKPRRPMWKMKSRRDRGASRQGGASAVIARSHAAPGLAGGAGAREGVAKISHAVGARSGGKAVRVVRCTCRWAA